MLVIHIDGLLFAGISRFRTVDGSMCVSCQIYGETVHMVEMAGSVLNQTVLANPDLQALLPANISTVVEQMIDNGYIYGRDYISKLVSTGAI